MATLIVLTHPDIEGPAVVAEPMLRFAKAKGWRLAGVQPGLAAAAADADVPKPQRNDSTAEWRAYAERRGMSPEQAQSMGRDELAAYYNPAPVPDQTEES